MSNELKLAPCPFCGGAASLNNAKTHASCEACNQLPWLYVEFWNRRASTASIAEDERAAFEAWYASRHDAVDFTRRPDDDQYDDWDIALQWNAWRARAALASQPAAREAARQSIDTEAFSDLLGAYFGNAMRASEANDPSLLIPARRALIAHVDTWGGATREEK